MFDNTLSKVIISIVISLIVVLGILFLLTDSFNNNIEEVNNSDVIKEEVFNENTYYNEFNIKINDLKFSDSFKKEYNLNNVYCGIGYFYNNIEDIKGLVEKDNCSNFINSPVIFDDRIILGDMKEGYTVVDAVRNGNNSVNLYLLINDRVYEIEVSYADTSYVVVENILRFELSGEIVVNSFDEISYITDNGRVIKAVEVV